MAKQVMPEANLIARATDINLTDEQTLNLSLFARLKRKPSLEKYPGALRLRHYRRGEAICRQGEAGWTAFYILTSDDELEVRRFLVNRAWKKGEIVLPGDLDDLEQRIAQLKANPNDEVLRRVATVHLNVARRKARKGPGLVDRLARKLFGSGDSEADRLPTSIIMDGPAVIDYGSMQAALLEGELFGEMSCMYGTPRSATIVANRDCFMLEMLRNILDQLQKDPSYSAQSDEVYKKRILQLHVRRLSIFSDLTEEQFARMRSQVELVSFMPGQIICDEFERSDCMYLIRSGLVKVVKKVSALLGTEHIRDWAALCTRLREGEKQPATPFGKIWILLPEKARLAIAQAADGKTLADGDRAEILYGLNDVLKNRQLPEAAEFKNLLLNEKVRERLQDLPMSRKNWSDQDVRRRNRALLGHLAEGAIRSYHRRVGPDCVLAYTTRGDFVGEMGVIENVPRSATCIAQGHPQDAGQAKDAGRVELVRIPEKAFWEMVEAAPAIQAKVQRKVAERKQQMQERVRSTVFSDSSNVSFSPEYEKLGLLQGQKLMLIDLDRCTRCDECVRACVSTHDDGRSRLFLDGPRFGKYLVPTTCRSCLDPVCMIGCPVGSIHRDNNGQMTIEDWCIGCGLCAKQCPYGSIQMYDIGIIPTDARGWRYLPAAVVKDAQWMRPKFADSKWEIGVAPFRNDPEFLASMIEHLPKDLRSSAALKGKPVYFRYEFQLAGDVLRAGNNLKLEVTSADPALAVWVNGQEVQPDKSAKGKREFLIATRGPVVEIAPPPLPKPPPRGQVVAKWKGGPEPTAELPEPVPVPPRKPGMVRAGQNVIAVQAALRGDTGDTLFELRMDEVHMPAVPSAMSEEITEKLVTELAVVCDLCSKQFGQVPACVNACPHDAAMRVDGRFEFPRG